MGFLLSSYGLSKWTLGEYSIYIWAFPLSLLIMLTAFLAGKAGERLGNEQMDLLTNFVKDSLKLK